MKAPDLKMMTCASLFAFILLFTAFAATAFAQAETSDTAEEIVVYGEKEGGGGTDVISIPIWMFQQIGNLFPELPEFPKFPGPGGGGDDTPEPDPCDELAAEIADLQDQLNNHQDALDNFGNVDGVLDLKAGAWYPKGSDGFTSTRAIIKGRTVLLKSKLARKQRKFAKECGS